MQQCSNYDNGKYLLSLISTITQNSVGIYTRTLQVGQYICCSKRHYISTLASRKALHRYPRRALDLKLHTYYDVIKIWIHEQILKPLTSGSWITCILVPTFHRVLFNTSSVELPKEFIFRCNGFRLDNFRFMKEMDRNWFTSGTNSVNVNTFGSLRRYSHEWRWQMVQ